MLSKLVEEFEKEYPNWNSLNSVNYNLSQVMMKWQDPKTADSILKGEWRIYYQSSKLWTVQNELDETKQIVSETLEKILDRGQKLDDLVSRSNELSEQSKDRLVA